MFDSPGQLFLGLITGIAFGFLLQKGQVAKFHVIVGQLLLKDWTVVKIMLTAIVVGAAGVWALVGLGQATLHPKAADFGGLVSGAVLFGIGMAVLGYCPGTAVAAAGEGHRDAWVGILGMLAGAGVFVGLYDRLRPMVQGLGSWGKATLPQLTHSSPWLWIAGLAVVAIVVAAVLERRRIRHT